MRIVCIGGGPAALYFSLLMKQQNPEHDIKVIERNRPYDTFGWGVVFSDQTLANLREADEKTADEILESFNHWDDIEVNFKGTAVRSGGHGFCGIGRKRLLNILQARCEELGVELVFETEVQSDEDYPDADLIIAADGLNSRIRTKYAETYQPDIDIRQCRFVWLGTRKLFDAFTFAFEKTEWGWFQVHAYRFDENTSTFIVEAPEEVWLKAGLDRMEKEESIAFCERVFAKYLDGNPLISNASHLRGSAQWIKFPRVVCNTWVHNNGHCPVVLMGDAAHTAHFSIGSGTKLAFEDAIELANSIRANPGSLPDALNHYQAVRSVQVLRIQNAARNSTEWFENVERYAGLEPEQFAYSVLTRSQRISHENLRLRDKDYVEGYEHWLASRAGVEHLGCETPPPMFLPFKVRDLVLSNRVIVSPMLQYSAVDGTPGAQHMVYLGSRAQGGAGLVFTEMAAVSADARSTPSCAGMYQPEHVPAWKQIVDFVHQSTQAKIAIQLGHAGAKGATKVAWEGYNQPLEEGGWPLLAASEQQWHEHSIMARAMDQDDLQRVKADFVNAAKMADEAGFDWLELQCAHGYLLSSFLSPLTNRRVDEYGGSVERRVRYPIEVFKAVREVWSASKPISVRISAHDWMAGGNTPDDAVEIAYWFKIAGVDVIDVSSGEVSSQEKPVYGRMYQTPFADRIRNEVGIPTIAVGGISEADHVNSIIGAGRADLCAVGRPHLASPMWTLIEAAKIGYHDVKWPVQYQVAKTQFERNLEREKALAGQNAGLSALQAANQALGA
ncbi:bifunctional salicylyl-CoA 5-hydroxylase/oxidoreductase [Vogesella sp. DC21W]|uniref:Bifunctional salicylyl-CoA 5-hydroxylase/oxidoreductase n=1 Tax=Vogesella aquatica TaxID=2984206 RepID=A0ABT5J2W8_9NEIS|nr:bifunctional salicylyl-CoA 5-hydroxylase/oxidoreductase [Vogesella aquatica]MDC7718683.1 bifunctional salicylyl-CoA 5-hydroxylase/oxidoreductase [Vogesella aquatica]